LPRKQALPGVEVEFAGGRERRRQRGDAAGKVQVEGLGESVSTGLRRVQRMRRCYLRRETSGKYAGC
jgi:hypothetical protein